MATLLLYEMIDGFYSSLYNNNSFVLDSNNKQDLGMSHQLALDVIFVMLARSLKKYSPDNRCCRSEHELWAVGGAQLSGRGTVILSLHFCGCFV